MPIEIVLQEGEAKLQINSPKFFKGGILELLPNERTIPYCLHVTGIESMVLSSDGHPEIFVDGLTLENNEFKIFGCNGYMSFTGRQIAVEFLRDEQAFLGMELLGDS